MTLARSGLGGLIVLVVPDWNDPRREALLFECKVGRGRLLACPADLTSDLDSRPAARQLRRSLPDYAAGRKCNPAGPATVDQLRILLPKQSRNH